MGIASIFKNEYEFVLEWLAFHRVIGFDHFIIADNESDDGTHELLTKLAGLGLVTVFDFPTSGARKPQLPAYSHILGARPRDIDVLAFIDADEFILPMGGADSLLPLMEQLFAPKDVSAVALNWATFGSSGHLFTEKGLVIERFTKSAVQTFGINHHYKSIVRPDRVECFENPHHARLWWGRYVNTRGHDVVLHPKHGAGLSAEVVWADARVNHYAVKSVEEFVLGKSRKGSASLAGRVKHKTYFDLHDRNDESCELAKAFLPRVRQELARLQDMLAQHS
jgi:glycosyltransferase involved in cell wall biosynthesis